MTHDQEVAQMNLLLNAANAVVNIEILDISKRLLKVNEEHLELFRGYFRMMKEEHDAKDV